MLVSLRRKLHLNAVSSSESKLASVQNAKVPIEIWMAICAYCDDLLGNDVRSLSLTCKHIRPACYPVVFNSITITTFGTSRKKLDFLISVAPFIRRLLLKKNTNALTSVLTSASSTIDTVFNHMDKFIKLQICRLAGLTLQTWHLCALANVQYLLLHNCTCMSNAERVVLNANIIDVSHAFLGVTPALAPSNTVVKALKFNPNMLRFLKLEYLGGQEVSDQLFTEPLPFLREMQLQCGVTMESVLRYTPRLEELTLEGHQYINDFNAQVPCLVPYVTQLSLRYLHCSVVGPMLEYLWLNADNYQAMEIETMVARFPAAFVQLKALRINYPLSPDTLQASLPLMSPILQELRALYIEFNVASMAAGSVIESLEKILFDGIFPQNLKYLYLVEKNRRIGSGLDIFGDFHGPSPSPQVLTLLGRYPQLQYLEISFRAIHFRCNPQSGELLEGYGKNKWFGRKLWAEESHAQEE